MSVAGSPPARGNFVRALLRRGSQVIATTPDDLPDRVVDPAPMPGWQRMSMMSTSSEEAVGDSLLARACNYTALGPLLYRIVAFPKVLIGFIASNGWEGLWPTLIASVLAIVLNVLAVVWALREPGSMARRTGSILAGDTGLGVLINLLVAVTVPVAVQPFAIDVAWTWLVGSIALWTLSFGLPAAMAMLAISVPLRAFLNWVGGVPVDNPVALTREVGCIVALAVAMVTSIGILILVGVGTRLALGLGIRKGRQAERLRSQRVMHDTVLQTLEAMAMSTPNDREHAPERLAELRRVAKARAAELREELTKTEETRKSHGLAEDLAALVTEMARGGLRTQLVAADVDDLTLSEARRTAIREAVREALRNTMKHAGTGEVVLRVEEREGGIAVIARDQGLGFSEEDRPPGFGISQSISARLAEVGGRSSVDSRPGRGTRVTLWVPR
jgi:signal transduction histidine kinase